ESPAGVAEAAGAPHALGERARLLQFDLDDRRDHQLGDAFARLHDEQFAAQVREQNLHLAAVVAVDGAWGVGQRDAVLARQARARAHLPLESRRDLERQPGRDGDAAPRRDLDRFVRRRREVQPRRPGGHVARRLRPGAQLLKADPGSGHSRSYEAATARKLCTTSGFSPRVAPRDRRILPVARSIAMTFTSISSPSLQTSSTRLTRFESSSLMCTRPSVPGRISTNAPNSASRLTTPR